MKFVLNIQLFASKKGVGSTKNGRDSESKRLGSKIGDGQFCKAGSIIYRQRGTKFIQDSTVVVVAMILYLLKLLALSNMKDSAEITRKFLFIQLLKTN